MSDAFGRLDTVVIWVAAEHLKELGWTTFCTLQHPDTGTRLGWVHMIIDGKNGGHRVIIALEVPGRLLVDADGRGVITTWERRPLPPFWER